MGVNGDRGTPAGLAWDPSQVGRLGSTAFTLTFPGERDFLSVPSAIFRHSLTPSVIDCDLAGAS